MLLFNPFLIDAAIESLAILALGANIYAYRQHLVQRYRIYSGLAMMLLSLHFFFLEAYAAGIGCGLAMIRNIVALRFNGWLCTGLFLAVNLLCFAYEWFVLHHGSEIIIAYTVSVIFTIGTLRIHQATQLKKLFLGAELLSIVYCVIIGSIFGSVYGLFNAAVITHWWVNYYRQSHYQEESHYQEDRKENQESNIAERTA